jgi:hypothetical protein
MDGPLGARDLKGDLAEEARMACFANQVGSNKL